jgi:hypothetical protein
MYAVATYEAGLAARLGLLVQAGRSLGWVALGAWAVVGGAMLAARLRALAGSAEGHGAGTETGQK